MKPARRAAMKKCAKKHAVATKKFHACVRLKSGKLAKGRRSVAAVMAHRRRRKSRR